MGGIEESPWLAIKNSDLQLAAKLGNCGKRGFSILIFFSLNVWVKVAEDLLGYRYAGSYSNQIKPWKLEYLLGHQGIDKRVPRNDNYLNLGPENTGIQPTERKWSSFAIFNDFLKDNKKEEISLLT